MRKMCFLFFAHLEGKTVKKIRMRFPNEKTFRGSKSCKTRNLRDGTIRHYRAAAYPAGHADLLGVSADHGKIPYFTKGCP